MKNISKLIIIYFSKNMRIFQEETTRNFNRTPQIKIILIF